MLKLDQQDFVCRGLGPHLSTADTLLPHPLSKGGGAQEVKTCRKTPGLGSGPAFVSHVAGQLLSLSFPIWGVGLCLPLCGAAVITPGLTLGAGSDQYPLGPFLPYTTPQASWDLWARIPSQADGRGLGELGFSGHVSGWLSTCVGTKQWLS